MLFVMAFQLAKLVPYLKEDRFHHLEKKSVQIQYAFTAVIWLARSNHMVGCL